MSAKHHTLPGPNPLARTGEFTALCPDASDSASYSGNVSFDVARKELDGPLGEPRPQRIGPRIPSRMSKRTMRGPRISYQLWIFADDTASRRAVPWLSSMTR
jgi:hypothetical protein